MTADEARRVDVALRGIGFPGVVAPVNADDPSGEWGVYDQADPGKRVDITGTALVALADSPVPDAGGRPRRGFVIPPTARA
ncbi:hypothetical protein [Streptomyces iconiensis]|uniref:PASTA domain-containing protein n=1 Tax=Streptomyces iconiensis TaxID=1384038 RepID=A0ABT7A8A2_9ACTN|nr:hypothetical protein [Streptomyces iconiensis]MDJ1137066.1 hypothetical protein [Streptomyces iconiensis]